MKPTAWLYLRVSSQGQVGRAFSEEGYSIEAQRADGRRRAAQLEAEVTAEFVDSAQSARTDGRPELQRMLAQLRSGDAPTYIIVHKADRLARNRRDDANLAFEIMESGAQLVSVKESIDGTPSGQLMHGILATISEFYSANLSAEAKKGLHRKARLGGTPGRAPIGYLNVSEIIDGHEVRTVAVDPERAPHIRWAFAAYASGQFTLDTLHAALKRRGLRTRPTPKQPARPLSRTQLARMLSKSYYVGIVTYGGVESEGRHKPLIDKDTFARAQSVLAGHTQAGEKDRKHHHYLKGSLACGHCGSRLTYVRARGRHGGIYWYFACIGRVTGTGCKLPYLSAHRVEDEVTAYWKQVMPSSKQVDAIRKLASKALSMKQDEVERETGRQRQRVGALTAEREKLMQAFYGDAISLDQLKREQDRIAAELAQADQIVALTRKDLRDGQVVLQKALELFEVCAEAYKKSSAINRRAWNQTFFRRLNVCVDGIESDDRAEAVADLTHPGFAARLAGKRTPDASAFSGRGSNMELLAEREGFEPSRELAPPTRLAGECLQPLGHLSGTRNLSGATSGVGRLGSAHASRPRSVARAPRSDLRRGRGALRLRRPRRALVERRRDAGAGRGEADPRRQQVGPLPRRPGADPAPAGLRRDDDLHPARDPLARRAGLRGPAARLPDDRRWRARGAGAALGRPARAGAGRHRRLERAPRPDRVGARRRGGAGPGLHRARRRAGGRPAAGSRSAPSAHRSTPPSRPWSWPATWRAGRRSTWSR